MSEATPELEDFLEEMNIKELKCWQLNTPEDIRSLYNFMIELGANPDEALGQISNVVKSLADYYEE